LKSYTLSDEPDDKPQGLDINGKKMWCALIDREGHKLCGWADEEGNCWHPYHGAKNPSRNEWKYVLGEVEENDEPYPEGFQWGANATWCILANTNVGLIPGKRHNHDNHGYYGHNGREHHVGGESITKIKNSRLSKTPDDKPQGYDIDGN